jgi:peptidoglycan/LPS O-acetylase OafA/YrhL
MYWLVTTAKIAIVLAIPTVMFHHRPTLAYALGSYALVPMMDAEGAVRPLHGVGWTLLHEMYFYYLFSVSLWLRKSPLVFAGSIIGALCTVGWFLPIDSAIARVCCDQINLLFVAGMALGHLLDRGVRLPAAVLGLVIGSPALLATVPFFGVGVLVWRDIGAVLVVYAAASFRIHGVARVRQTLAGLGDASYSLYLIHPILAPALCVALWKTHLRFEPALFAIVFVVTIVAGQWVYQAIERPLNRAARSFLFPQPAAARPIST